MESSSRAAHGQQPARVRDSKSQQKTARGRNGHEEAARASKSQQDAGSKSGGRKASEQQKSKRESGQTSKEVKRCRMVFESFGGVADLFFVFLWMSGFWTSQVKTTLKTP